MKSVLVGYDLLEVFLDNLMGMTLHKKVDFCLDLNPRNRPISIPPYRMTLVELRELKYQLQGLLEKRLHLPNSLFLGCTSVVCKKRC